jgi:hypothetical protein
LTITATIVNLDSLTCISGSTSSAHVQAEKAESPRERMASAAGACSVTTATSACLRDAAEQLTTRCSKPGRRWASIFLDKHRRHIGKSQSKTAAAKKDPAAAARTAVAPFELLELAARRGLLAGGLEGERHAVLEREAAARRPQYLFRDKNRCDIGKSQSVWTDSKHGNAPRLTHRTATRSPSSGCDQLMRSCASRL